MSRRRPWRLRRLFAQDLIERDGVIVDAASGVTGAGRAPKHNTLFCTVDEDFTAYGLLDHRHTPEMEQEIGAQILFTPHMAPMNRGILATCYARPAGTSQPLRCWPRSARFYSGEPFVVVRPALAVDQSVPRIEHRPHHRSL